MIKHLSFLPVLAGLFLNFACDEKVATYPAQGAGAEPLRSGDTDPEAGGSSGGATTPKGAFELQLDELVTQSAPWGDIQISVQRARLLRGDRPAGFPGSERHSRDSIYAILEVKLDSNSEDDNDYTDRKTWDLLLANDKRIEPLNALGLTLAADETEVVELFYEVEENTSLKGASLEINGRERPRFEPMKIPLDVPTKFESQVELSDLVGETAEPDGGDFSFEIINALYGVNLESSGRRAERDQRLLELTVRVGNDTDSSATFGASNEAIWLSVDGDEISPEPFDSRTLSGGQRRNFVLVYSIRESISELDLVFDLGDELLELYVDLPSGAGNSRSDDDESGRSDDESSDDTEFEEESSDDETSEADSVEDDDEEELDGEELNSDDESSDDTEFEEE